MKPVVRYVAATLVGAAVNFYVGYRTGHAAGARSSEWVEAEVTCPSCHGTTSVPAVRFRYVDRFGVLLPGAPVAEPTGGWRPCPACHPVYDEALGRPCYGERR